jgi:glycosidase
MQRSTKITWSFILTRAVRVLKCFTGLVFVTILMLTSCSCSKDSEPVPIDPPIEEPEPKQYDVPFANVPATRDIAMYEINFSAFSTTGDLNGVKARLDEIKDLGVNVIWLMPIYPIGDVKSVGSPYAIKDYTKVNPALGSLEDLRSLVKEAHSRNMAVILDWVANHTAWDHTWIQNSSWYTRDAQGNITSPAGHNWTDVADLNYGSQAMRKEMIKAMKYWVLEANVDGFRCDYAEGVPVDFWKAAIDTLRNIPGRDLVMFAEAGKSELYSAGFDLTFGWNFYHKLKDVYNNASTTSALVAANTTDYNSIPQGNEILRWITNHDDNAWDNSPVTIFKTTDGALSAFVITSYMGGVPLLYNGQEVGCPVKLGFFENNTTKIDWSINGDLLSMYKKIMTFRNASSAVKQGTLESFATSDVVAFKRVYNGEEVLVMVNVRGDDVVYAVPSALQNTSWSNAITGESLSLATTVELHAFDFLILKK